MSGTATPTIVNFTEIPYTWKVPGQYMEIKPALNENAVLPFPARGLIIGQMYAAGTAVPGTIYPLYSPAQAKGLFGAGSILAEMCSSWLAANPYLPVDVVGVLDATGAAAAAGSVTIAGAATAAGTLALELAGVRLPVAVNIGDTADEVATNIYDAFQQLPALSGSSVPSLLMAYVGGTAVTNLTAGNAGTLGNQLAVLLNMQSGDVTPPGLTVTIVPMSGGATDPTATVSAVLAGITSTWYTDVAFPWTDATNTLTFTTWMAGRYGAMAKLDVQGYVATTGTYGTVLTYEPNSQFLTILPVQNSRAPTWKIAAGLAGACCYSTAQQPSLQMKTVVLPGIVAPLDVNLFSLDERESLLENGFSTFYSDSTGAFYLERVTTSRRSDPASNAPDLAWFDLCATKVPTRVRYDWDNYIGALYPRANLAQDGSIAAQYSDNVVTPSDLTAQWAGRSRVYEENGWIQNSAATVKNSVFVIDAQDGNRVDSRQQIQIMGNLMVLAGSLEFISTN